MSVDGVKLRVITLLFPLRLCFCCHRLGELWCFLGDVPNITTPKGISSFFFILASGSLALDVDNRNG